MVMYSYLVCLPYVTHYQAQYAHNAIVQTRNEENPKTATLYLIQFQHFPTQTLPICILVYF